MKLTSPATFRAPARIVSHGFLLLWLLVSGVRTARGEAMLELFQLTWPEITQKMPEVAEAGYDSLWLPNPAKGESGAYSVGYDVFDPFDLGSVNQQGTIATKYGTRDQLIQMVQTAHRFGVRVYFDNVMNHRAGTVPGYPGSGTPTNYYPGLIPQDFHLQVVSGGYKNWSDVSDWCNVTNVEDNPLLGLCDLANEPGTINSNFGPNYLDTTSKPFIVRTPLHPELYMDPNLPSIGGNWHPFDGHGQATPEYVQDYLDRAVAWTLYITKCDGFRLDAVKHVPVAFFGNETGQNDDSAFAGYTGAIQAMYDYVHGYGTNVTGDGYAETDGNRNSLFDTEAPRNDAMIFGEYEPSALPLSEDYYDYLNSGMRLLNQLLYNQFNNAIGNYGGSPGFYGMDGRDYIPPGNNCDGNGNFSGAQAVNYPQTQDGGSCCPVHQELQDAYYFMHEGLPMVYSDGFNHNTNGGTPIVSYANYLGEFGDDSMPDAMYTHNQLARGGTRSRWSDQNIIAFARYDYRDVDPPSLYGNAYTNSAATVVFFAMNDNYGYPGDISFDDGVSRPSDGYYLVATNTANGAPTADVFVSNSRGQGLSVGFPPGTVLVQLSSSGDAYGGYRAFHKLLVHGATSSSSAAASSANAADPVQRLIYVGGQTITPGGGAIELVVPSGGWVMYAKQWPEASRANASTNAIIFRQNGIEVPHITISRHDGPDGDPGFNPIYPFEMRGSVDPYGNAIGGVHVSNLTYAIDVPVVTNTPFDILVRSDASTANTLVKLDGGTDLNSQMGLSSTFGRIPPSDSDLRDNKPGYADDRFLGYEQTALQFRNGPEKFAARNVLSNTIVSLGAETYYYTNGGGSRVVAGSGYGQDITNQTVNWVYHDPAATNTALPPDNTAAQRVPLNPAGGQPADIYIKVGYQFETNNCFIYYTTDGSNPEGAFGIGKGMTHVVQAHFLNHDSAQTNIDWWLGTIPGQPAGTQVRYKIGLFYGGSVYPNQSIAPISCAESSGSKLYGLTQAAITNFNPATAVVWLHNDLNTNNTIVGLQSGFHIVRARTFLPVNLLTNQNYVYADQAQVYDTFVQTFYYDAGPPTGMIAFPPNNGVSISSSSYTVVVRADSTVTGVDFNIQDSNPNNDDVTSGQANGNGNDTNGQPVYVSATQVTPDPSLNLQYPTYPQEFGFAYNNVPSSGTATIRVRLKDYATSLYTNEVTTLTRTVNTVGPPQMVQLASPATNGSVITLTSNLVYLIQACFSSSLASAVTNFEVLVNGVLQPQSAYILSPVGANPNCPGMQSLTYNWDITALGTNVIEVAYTNGIIISDTRTVIVAPPFQITGLSGANPAGTGPLVVWGSVPNVRYQVLATTNLTQPFAPIGPIISTNGFTASFQDTSPPAPQKFYEIEIVP